MNCNTTHYRANSSSVPGDPTLAILPDRSHAGLGSYLIARCQAAARAIGMTRSIFAFMHDSNYSRNIAARYGEPMRRYGLFARKLT